MATVLSVTTVRNACQRVTWQWVDAFGTIYGPQVDHIAEGLDAQDFADAREVSDLASLAEAELHANIGEIADGA